MGEKLDYNEVFAFMKKFNADFINRFGEMIIDHKNNIYLPLNECKDLADIETWAIFVLCRPIGKGLETKEAKRLLYRVNKYFQTELTREDMHLIYGELCYRDKLKDFKGFVQAKFPMNELKKGMK